MTKPKYDGVIVAVHYQSDKLVDWVRTYLRRGPIFSDRVMLGRQVLVDQLNDGKRFVVGKRVPNLAGTFEVTDTVKLIVKDHKEVIVAGEQQGDLDSLEGVPQI